MKEAWSEENDQTEVSNRAAIHSPKSHRPSLLNGLTSPPDRATVLASLPTRELADKLVVRFFESYNPAMPAQREYHQPCQLLGHRLKARTEAIHKETFLKQVSRHQYLPINAEKDKYNNHWVDPKRSKIVWIGLLFAVMCHALQSYRRNKEEPSDYQGTSAAMIDLFRIRTAQCLTIADITRPTKYMVETMLIYSMLEYSEESGGDSGSWLLVGSAVRLATQQGYHRDPVQHPNISIFDGEMRRRVWAMASHYELLLCVKIGLPKTIRLSECDVAPPRNVYEEELYEDMEKLPASRPLLEPAPISYYITKYHVLNAYGHVVESLHVIQPQSYTEVMRLDRMVMEAREMIPLHLQVRPLDEMMNDPPSRIMERYLLDIFCQKALCLLHRKHWSIKSHGSPDTYPFFYSRKICVSSSMMLLDEQASMHRASQPGGPLSRMKWYHFGITNHDFLLATMILCLDLVMMTREPDLGNRCIISAFEKLDCIKRSRSIWAEIVDDCADARRAVNILDTLIRKFSVRSFLDKS